MSDCAQLRPMCLKSAHALHDLLIVPALHMKLIALSAAPDEAHTQPATINTQHGSQPAQQLHPPSLSVLPRPRTWNVCRDTPGGLVSSRRGCVGMVWRGGSTSVGS